MRLPVTLEVKRSRGLVAVLCAAHFLVATGLWQAALPLAPQLICWMALASSLFVTLSRGHRNSALILNGDGRLSLLGLDGIARDSEVSPATTVFPWLVVLLVKTERRSQALVLPIDALGMEGHRQLRLWLRWKTNAEPA